jgi:hypothetical protein
MANVAPLLPGDPLRARMFRQDAGDRANVAAGILTRS